MTSFAIIGFGEVGGLFARDLLAGGADAVQAFDVAPAAMARARSIERIGARDNAIAAAASADIVFVCVTAGSVLAAMDSLAGGLSHGPLVVDVNSVAPSTKREAACRVAEAGGRYVEVAVMGSAPPRGLRTPMLVGGPDAEAFLDAMRPFELDAGTTGGEIGRASSIKMCRSVVVKGMEALMVECLTAARYYGIEPEVLTALEGTLTDADWPSQARYLLQRTVQHGRRRAEEMREVALTVADAGLEPLMSRATAERQDWAAGRLDLLGPE